MQSITDDAADAVVKAIRSHLNAVDLAVVFFTADHRDRIANAIERIWTELEPQAIVGCSAEGVIGTDREIERSSGISLLAGRLPGAKVHPFHIATDDWRHLLRSPDDLLERIDVADQTRAILGFGDPWTTPLNQFMQALDMLAPRSPLVGGMASGAQRAGDNVLICNDQTHNDGLVGLSLGGNIDVRTVVSQGARPLGRSMVITRSHENVIEQLGGKPAMSALREIVLDLDDRDRALLQQGLLVGRAISEYRESWTRGDFLVRNVVGVDQESGAIAVADLVRTGQTIQFHVRDTASATQDMHQLLDSAAQEPHPSAALLFSCNGRGTRMFEKPDHDIALLRAHFPNTPAAGFFAAGEFGPVSGRNFIHGHTASVALLRTSPVSQ